MRLGPLRKFWTTREVWSKTLGEENAAQVKEKFSWTLTLLRSTPKKFLEYNVFSYSRNWECHKNEHAKLILIFESKRVREKFQVTEIHSRFGDKEIILRFQKQWSSLLGNGKEPIFLTLFLPEYVSDQAMRLVFSNLEKSSFYLLAGINSTDI